MSLELASTLYPRIQAASIKARLRFGRPVTLTEKILASHAIDFDAQPWERGVAMLALRPDRVAMQDATAQMALLQFIQAGRERTTLPSSIHCDHLIQGRDGAREDLSRGLSENQEVFAFLASAAKKYGIDFWRPGSGIIHQVILENYAVPGALMIGTDSHTPNAGGLGMLAVGVGGADAGEVMAGLPWEVLQPRLIGIKLTGALSGWVAPKDVILHICGKLTVQGGTNKVLEYFGPGVESISCTGKATITNMGAELGATCSIFPFDRRMADYLRGTSRGPLADLAEANLDCLTADPEVALDPARFFDEVLEVDLSALVPQVVGPHTPDLTRSTASLGAEAKEKGYPLQLRAALIGSCTNSSYEDLSRAVDLARQALAAGLKPKAPMFISPGSERIYNTIGRDGFLDTFRELGATVLTNACGPCIGQWARPDVVPGRVDSIITSFNRNFPGRNDGRAETMAFIAGPEIVMAMAFGGSLDFDPLRDSLDGPNGKFRFAPPTGEEMPKRGYERGDAGFQAPAQDGRDIQIEIAPDSERLSLLAPFPPWNGHDFLGLVPLLKTSGKTTTDHISPAGPWLRYRGHLDRISDNMFLGATNAFTGERGKGTDALTGQTGLPIAQIARNYKAKGVASIVIGDQNYGEGSSREHAAMSPRYLGVKVVLARSFARIHETNLKKQGILPLVFSDPANWEQLEATDRVDVLDLARLAPGRPVQVVLRKAGGSAVLIQARHTFTQEQIAWFRAGSALNAVGAREAQ
jgi:aconitate hydratase